MANKRIDEATQTQTVGHEWDGIEELDTPMPRWWLWTFYLSILFSIGYMIAYPAWPLISKGTEGQLGWTSRGQLADELEKENARRAPILKALAATPIEDLPNNPETGCESREHQRSPTRRDTNTSRRHCRPRTRRRQGR